VDELGDNGVIIMVRIWAPSREWWSVRTEMLWKIKQALEREGLGIPFPQRVVWIAREANDSGVQTRLGEVAEQGGKDQQP